MLDSEATVGAFRHSALAVEFVGDLRNPPSRFVAKDSHEDKRKLFIDTREDTRESTWTLSEGQ